MAEAAERAPRPRDASRDWLVALSLLVVVCVLAAEWPTSELPLDRERAIERATGWGALSLLALSLSITPIRRLAPRLPIGPWRRTLGVTGALAGLAHAAIGAVRYAGLSLATLDALPWLRHGALAALVLLPLLLTSFAPITRALSVRAWKALHLAAYAATPLALLHALESPGSDLRAVQALAAMVGLGLVLRLVPRRAPGDETDLVHTRAPS
jgi:DMSO/TMAO reductase YedYZ heme-binding membrane subunit